MAAVTEGSGDDVTCPILRYHPAVVAQKAATLALLSEGRFSLCVGTGERLNEHVVGRGWPSADERQEMLAEAIEIMKLLWDGGYQTYRGDWFDVEDARVFDLPDQPVPIAVAAGGPQAAELAGTMGDGLVATDADASLVEAFRGAGGEGKPTWAQIPVCWADDAERALATAHHSFRWSALGWKVQAELPNPVNFDAASGTVRPEDLAESIPHGPDPAGYVAAAREFAEAGFERIAFLQIGDDQQGFFASGRASCAPVPDAPGARGGRRLGRRLVLPGGVATSPPPEVFPRPCDVFLEDAPTTARSAPDRPCHPARPPGPPLPVPLYNVRIALTMRLERVHRAPTGPPGVTTVPRS